MQLIANIAWGGFAAAMIIIAIFAAGYLCVGGYFSPSPQAAQETIDVESLNFCDGTCIKGPLGEPCPHHLYIVTLADGTEHTRIMAWPTGNGLR